MFLLLLVILHILAFDISIAYTVQPKLRYFINLTNGIEAMPNLLQQKGLELSDMQFIRIQSSHCEACDHEALIANLDYNFLMSLALGNVNIVYDLGSRGIGMPDHRDGIPRSMWWGTEFIRHTLEDIWDLPGKDSNTRMVKGCNVKLDFDQRVQNLPKNLRKRIKYFRNYLSTDKLLWYNVYDKTEHDGQQTYYADILRDLHGVGPSDDVSLDRGITAGVGSSKELDALIMEKCVPKGMNIYKSSDFVGFGRSEGMASSDDNTQTPLDPWTSI